MRRAQRLEIARLSRTVQVGEEELAGLEVMDADELATLRDQVAAALFDPDREAFERIAAITRAVPAAVSARLCQLVLPPVIAARATPLLDPRRAADLTRRIAPAYLADIAVALDPRSVSDVLAVLPADSVSDVARILADRGEWIVMADFVAHISVEALEATVEALEESEILCISAYLEALDRASLILGLLSDERVAALVGAAADDLGPVLAELVAALDDEQAARVASARERAS